MKMRWDLILLSHVIAVRPVIDLGGHARYKLIDLFCFAPCNLRLHVPPLVVLVMLLKLK